MVQLVVLNVPSAVEIVQQSIAAVAELVAAAAAEAAAAAIQEHHSNVAGAQYFAHLTHH